MPASLSTNMLFWIILAIVVLGGIIYATVAYFYPQIVSGMESIIPLSGRGEELSLEQGFKAIHVSLKMPTILDPEVNVYEFHPTNEGALGRKHLAKTSGLSENEYYFLKKFEADKCYILASGPVLSALDEGRWIYRVSQGSKILKSSSSPATLTSNLLFNKNDENCEWHESCSSMTPGEFTVCGGYVIHNKNGKTRQVSSCAQTDNEKLKVQQFTSSSADNCAADEEGCPSFNGRKDCCAFAAKQADGSHVYDPAYDILCGIEQGGSEAKWHACTDSNQNTRIEANGAQYSCDGYEWIVRSGTGVQMLEPKLRYESGPFVVDHTDLEFVFVNNQDKDIADVKVSAKVADPESSVKCWGNTDYGDSVTKTAAAVAKNGGPFKYSHDNFCYKAKTFDVKIVYKIKEGSADVDKTEGFRIECKNADTDKGDWQNCIATAASSTGFGGSW